MVRIPTLPLWISALAILFGCNVQPDAELAAFGDSVTWGYGGLPGGWVRRLEESSGFHISNLGVPGERASGAIGRIDAALRSVPRAKVMFILHGGNDWVQAFRSSYCNRNCDPAVVNTKYEDVGDGLRKIRRLVDERGIKPVFLTYWPNSAEICSKYDAPTFAIYQTHRQRLNAEIIEVAAEHDDHVVLMGDIPGFGEDSHNFFDCLHPSAQGYRKLAARILEDFSSWEPPEPGFKDLWQVYGGMPRYSR